MPHMKPRGLLKKLRALGLRSLELGDAAVPLRTATGKGQSHQTRTATAGRAQQESAKADGRPQAQANADSVRQDSLLQLRENFDARKLMQEAAAIGMEQQANLIRLRRAFAARLQLRESARAAMDSAWKRREPRKVIPLVPRKRIARFMGSEADLWETRRHYVLQLAKRLGGRIRLCDVAAECNVHVRTAADWLKRLATEGQLALIAEGSRNQVYALREVDDISTK